MSISHAAASLASYVFKGLFRRRNTETGQHRPLQAACQQTRVPREHAPGRRQGRYGLRGNEVTQRRGPVSICSMDERIEW
jgi:hypothetical protein